MLMVRAACKEQPYRHIHRVSDPIPTRHSPQNTSPVHELEKEKPAGHRGGRATQRFTRVASRNDARTARRDRRLEPGRADPGRMHRKVVSIAEDRGGRKEALAGAAVVGGGRPGRTRCCADSCSGVSPVTLRI